MPPARLTPTASSRKLLVLAFIRDYRARMGGSPSAAEIAAGQGISVGRAKAVLRALEADGSILRAKGVRRGIVLPGEAEQALTLLRRLGWNIEPPYP